MILVTGASGQLASKIVAGIRACGLTVETASRAETADRCMDFDRPETLNFQGVEVLFLTSAGYAEDDIVMRRHGDVLRRASEQGVKHVIYTSLSRASDHLGFALAHRWTERALQDSGMAWTILRNGLYAELIGTLAAPQDGKIRMPYGHGPISAVTRADLAEAAVAVLASPEKYRGMCLELSGSSAFSVADLAEGLGAAYTPSSLAEERERLNALPLLPFQAPMLLSIASAAAAGMLQTNSTDLKQLVPAPKDALAAAIEAAAMSQS